MRLQVLVYVFVCEYSRAFLSLAFASFDSHVGNALLVCARSHSRLALACDIASDTSHLHTFVNLRLSKLYNKDYVVYNKDYVA